MFELLGRMVLLSRSVRGRESDRCTMCHCFMFGTNGERKWTAFGEKKIGMFGSGAKCRGRYSSHYIARIVVVHMSGCSAVVVQLASQRAFWPVFVQAGLVTLNRMVIIVVFRSLGAVYPLEFQVKGAFQLTTA